LLQQASHHNFKIRTESWTFKSRKKTERTFSKEKVRS